MREDVAAFRMFSRSGSVVQCSMIFVPVASATSRAAFRTLDVVREIAVPSVDAHLEPKQAIAVVRDRV